MRQPLLWLLSGILIGIGFITAFSGGLLFVVMGFGLAVGLGLKYRYRHRWRGWSGLLYGAGASIALFLLPYVMRPSPCVQNARAGCYTAFTTGVFVVAVLLALAGIGFGLMEVRRWRRTLVEGQDG